MNSNIYNSSFFRGVGGGVRGGGGVGGSEGGGEGGGSEGGGIGGGSSVGHPSGNRSLTKLALISLKHVVLRGSGLYF